MTMNNGEKALAIPGDGSSPFVRRSPWLKLNSSLHGYTSNCLFVFCLTVEGVGPAVCADAREVSLKQSPKEAPWEKAWVFGDHQRVSLTLASNSASLDFLFFIKRLN